VVNRFRPIFSLLVLACVLGSVSLAQQENTTENITIDGAAPARPFPHFWEQMFGSGRANLSLRESYREDLKTVKEHTGFTYVRFHAILDDENGVYDEDPNGNPIYNFSYVDQIYDGLLANKVKPFVELSFMPPKLAANLTPHPFWYKPLPSPPKDPSKWSSLIQSFTRHLIDRYGKDEVEQWYFEVWNEPNIDFWDGDPKQATYFALYDVTAKAIKQVDPALRVGGPATAQAAWVDAFISHCKQNNIPFDFVSTHVYGNEDSKNVFGRNLPISRRDMVGRSAKKVYDQVKASAAPDTPIIWSEYNATYMTQQQVTDSAFMGPWLANNIRECDGLANVMSYWTFSDVFEEQGVVKTPFYGGYGLIAEFHLPKAAFWDFDLLHQLGNERVIIDSQNALVTKRPDGAFVVALWNYSEPGENAGPKTFQLVAKHLKAKTYKLQFVSPNHGSVLEDWEKLGSPAYPTDIQVRKLIDASRPGPPQKFSLDHAIVLGPQTLAVLEVGR
jgi:xylan 1,4-beta-xylosidase